MSLVLNEDQQLLRDSAKSFCQQNAPLSLLRSLRDSKDELGYDSKLWQQMLGLGWAGMAIPEEYGGYGFGYHGLGIVLEETGRTLASSPLIASVLMGASAVLVLGSERQKQDLLPRIANGELLLTLAVDETGQHRPQHTNTSATQSGDGYVLNGSKTFVLDGHIADKLIVVARSAGEIDSESGISLFLVDRDTPGLEITRTWMVDSRNAAKLRLTDVRVPAEALLGTLDQGFAGLSEVLDIGRVGVAAEMLGSIQEVFERILEYLKQREQFGVLIGSFQGLQHRAAIMYSEIELCKSLVRAALGALDDPEQTPAQRAELASACKAKLSEVFFLVSNEGIQMHGGIGMTDEFDIGFFIKRARVAQMYLGDARYHRDRYAAAHNF